VRATTLCFVSAGIRTHDGSLVDVSGSCDDLGRHVLQTAGIYTVRISSSGTATGSYAFTVLPSK
jgi:hypothetical protein